MPLEKIPEKISNKPQEAIETWLPKIIDDAHEKYRYDSEFLLVKLREKFRELMPSREELERLPEDEKLNFLQFLGRFSASINWAGYLAGIISKSWKQNLALETREVADSSSNPVIRQFIERLAQIGGLHLARESNSNTYGNAPDLQAKLVANLAKDFSDHKQTKEAQLLLNPFNLRDGTTFYTLSPDRQHLEEKQIEILHLNGADPSALIDGKNIKLAGLNNDLASGEYMLRDGSNYFGGLEQFLTTLNLFRSGEKITVVYRTPLQEENTMKELICAGTNQKELEQKYGKAYLPYLKNLLVVKFLADGKKEEVPYQYFEVK